MQKREAAKSAGFGAVEIVIAIVVVLVVSLIGWRLYGTAKKPAPTTGTSNSSSTSNDHATGSNGGANANQPAVQTQTISMLDGALQVSVPSGWTKKNENQLTRTVSGLQYMIQIQQTATDYLAGGNYASNMSVLGAVKNSAGNSAYIIKTSGYASVSTCSPASDKACSFTLNGKPLFILLATYEAQYPGNLDFGDTRTSQAVGDLTILAQHLSL